MEMREGPMGRGVSDQGTTRGLEDAVEQQGLLEAGMASAEKVAGVQLDGIGMGMGMGSVDVGGDMEVEGSAHDPDGAADSIAVAPDVRVAVGANE